MVWVQCSVKVDDTTRVSIMGKSIRGEIQMMKCKDQLKVGDTTRVSIMGESLWGESQVQAKKAIHGLRYVLDSGVVAPLMLYMLEEILSSLQMTSKTRAFDLVTRAFDLVMNLGVHGHLLEPVLLDDASTIEEEYTQEPYLDKIIAIQGITLNLLLSYALLNASSHLLTVLHTLIRFSSDDEDDEEQEMPTPTLETPVIVLGRKRVYRLIDESDNGEE
ncbi:hypothetical protein Tco_1028894 [Tanacetum coccineum]|uniref:Uncharacterized protein n=1 Tax=Tanacetum coccineum TaxID=301880 RepID=A0ABQ5G3E1_9ASTR